MQDHIFRHHVRATTYSWTLSRTTTALGIYENTSTDATNYCVIS